MVEKKKPSHKESQNPKAKSQKPKAEQKQKSRTNAEQNRTKAEQKQNKSRKKQNKSRTKQSKSSTVFTINFIIDPSERHHCFRYLFTESTKSNSKITKLLIEIWVHYILDFNNI